MSGNLDFNPVKDALEAPDGKKVFLKAPVASELPEKDFAAEIKGFVAPAADADRLEVKVAAGSTRLELLKPFEPWDGKDFTDLLVLLKAQGKCTTDHLSPAGKWLQFRGHLANISDNLFLTVVNAFTGETGKGRDVLTGEKGVTFPALAKRYKSAGKSWVAFGDVNYGEGSSREHAAMEPRYMGAKAIITRSFARIHETNLKTRSRRWPRRSINALRNAAPRNGSR